MRSRFENSSPLSLMFDMAVGVRRGRRGLWRREEEVEEDRKEERVRCGASGTVWRSLKLACDCTCGHTGHVATGRVDGPVFPVRSRQYSACGVNGSWENAARPCA